MPTVTSAVGRLPRPTSTATVATAVVTAATGETTPTVDTTIARHQGNLVHANVFMTEGIIRRLVEAAGFDVVAVHPPRDPFITFDDDIEFDDEEPLLAGQHSIGQGVCIARRPGALPEG